MQPVVAAAACSPSSGTTAMAAGASVLHSDMVFKLGDYGTMREEGRQHLSYFVTGFGCVRAWEIASSALVDVPVTRVVPCSTSDDALKLVFYLLLHSLSCRYSPEYAAPEALTHGTSRAGPPSDLWSLGITAVQLLLGRLPAIAVRVAHCISGAKQEGGKSHY
jgi:serine/threonine protein kinase